MWGPAGLSGNCLAGRFFGEYKVHRCGVMSSSVHIINDMQYNHVYCHICSIHSIQYILFKLMGILLYVIVNTSLLC